ncbi:NUMOD3 domain-containing DNA-binding protein [Rhizobium leguminosarum]
MSDFYVYAWSRPDTGSIFYIGKGRGRRAHSISGRSRHFLNIVGKLRLSGLSPKVDFIAVGLSESDAFSMERECIAMHGRLDIGSGSLVNLTDGGEGVAGIIMTEIHRAGISRGRTGKRHTDETREKLREAKLGRSLSDEHKKNISLAQIGSKHSATSKAKIGAAHKGKVISAEHKGRIVAKLSGRKLPADHIQKMSASMLARFADENVLEAHAITIRSLPPLSNNASGFKGVSYRKDRGVWRATIRLSNRQVFLGVFASAELAAKAYDNAAFSAHGFDCYLNFPEVFTTSEAA